MSLLGDRHRNLTRTEEGLIKKVFKHTSLPPLSQIKITNGESPTGTAITIPLDDNYFLNLGQRLYYSDVSHMDPRTLVHEMTHVWQAQKLGPWYLPLCRPFSRRYDYELKPGWPLESYGIEQQAEIVRHAFLLRNGAELAGAPAVMAYESILPFEAE